MFVPMVGNNDIQSEAKECYIVVKILVVYLITPRWCLTLRFVVTDPVGK